MDFKIIQKKLLKEKLNPSEERMFQQWFNNSEENRKYYNNAKSNFKDGLSFIDSETAWRKIYFKIRRKNRRVFFRKFITVASVVVIIISISLELGWFSNNPTKNNFEKLLIVDEDSSPERVQTAGTPILIRPDGSNLTLVNRGSYSIKDSLDQKNMVGGSNNIESGNLEYNTLIIPRGGQFSITLSDGTKVWLNSETKIKFPEKFDYEQNRVVELVHGEAYFDVISSEQVNGSAFFVHTKGQSIKVLGTEFNVKAYQEEQTIATTLVEGKVFIETEIQSNFLLPGEQAIIDKHSHGIKKQKVEIQDQISWKSGIFSFKDMAMSDIMIVLARWYDFDVVYNSEKVKTVLFNGIFKKEQKLEDIIWNINQTNEIKCKLINKTVHME